LEGVKPFIFMDCVKILKSTGKRASNLRELRDIIGETTEACLFHHVCEYFLKGHVLEYTNDFAHWAGESLEERALSEYLSNIDPFEFRTMEQLRAALLSCIDDYLTHFPEPRGALKKDEFYFNETASVVFPIGMRAGNLAEFLLAIKFIDAGSLYYHFYEARIRHKVDDFSTWIKDTMGKQRIVTSLQLIDPFMHNIEGIRQHILELVDKELQEDMEAMGK